MFKLGLTGSIAMGKSTAAAEFAAHGCAVWDADAAVHSLYAVGGVAVKPLQTLNPNTVINNAVSRTALKTWIAEDPTALHKIEIHRPPAGPPPPR